MTKTPVRPARWLRDRARDGLVDLPANAAWLLGRAFPEPDGAASPATRNGSGVRAGAQRAKVALTDAIPGLPDSVESRARQAHAALADAREAERKALEAAESAKESAARATQAREDADRRIAQAVEERDALVAEREQRAQVRADAMVAEARQAAEGEGDKLVAKVREQADREAGRAQAEAEAARARAQQQVDDATARLAEARRLAEEAAAAAQEAADAAHAEAERLADDAGRHAEQAEEQLRSTEQLQQEVTREAAQTVRAAEGRDEVADLSEHTRAELLELAAALDVDGRSSMRKAELVRAVKKATAAAR